MMGRYATRQARTRRTSLHTATAREFLARCQGPTAPPIAPFSATARAKSCARSRPCHRSRRASACASTRPRGSRRTACASRPPPVTATRDCNARGKRLPTEEEFEFAACNGAKRSPYPWGTDGDFIPPVATQTGCDDVAKRLPLDDRDVSEAGVVALSTGVSEWTASPWTESLDRTAPYLAYKFTVRGASDCRPSNGSLQHRDGGDGSLTPPSEIGFRCATAAVASPASPQSEHTHTIRIPYVDKIRPTVPLGPARRGASPTGVAV